MLMTLLGLLVLFCTVVGAGAAMNHYSAWALLAYSFAAVVTLQLTYLLTLIVITH